MKSLKTHIAESLSTPEYVADKHPKFEEPIFDYVFFKKHRLSISEYIDKWVSISELNDSQKEFIDQLKGDLTNTLGISKSRKRKSFIVNGEEPYYKRSVFLYTVLKWALENNHIDDSIIDKISELLTNTKNEFPEIDNASWDTMNKL